MYDDALLTRCYTQHTLRPLIFLKQTSIGILQKFSISVKESVLLTYIISIRIDPSLHPHLLISKIPNHQLFVINMTSPYETQYLFSLILFPILKSVQVPPIICYKYNNPYETQYLFSINLFPILISMLLPISYEPLKIPKCLLT